jgi:paraquat-inducible protein A
VLLIGFAYQVSGTIFAKTIDTDRYFGISFGKENIFNQLLFFQLSITISGIAFIHFISVLTGKRFSVGRYLLAGMIVAAFILFSLGTNTPLIKTTKFYFIKENYSLIDVLMNLKNKNEILLYWIMLLFTFIVPILKMTALSFEIFFPIKGGNRNHILGLLSKWAMVDVLLLAILIACMKSGSGLVEMSSSTGLVYFITSVVTSLLITTLLPYLKPI